MDDKVKISFYGPSDKLNSFKKHQEELQANYNTEFKVAERFSNFDGGGDEEINMSIKVEVHASFLGYVGAFILKEGAKYILKKAIFKPLTDWLERIDNTEENTADELVFLYDDIVIKIAYAKRNHQNIVGLVTVELVKQVSQLNQQGLGNLTTVATPVGFFNPEWKFFMPDVRFNLNQYFLHWGLEYNGSNKCILHLPHRKIEYSHWW